MLTKNQLLSVLNFALYHAVNHGKLVLDFPGYESLLNMSDQIKVLKEAIQRVETYADNDDVIAKLLSTK